MSYNQTPWDQSCLFFYIFKNAQLFVMKMCAVQGHRCLIYLVKTVIKDNRSLIVGSKFASQRVRKDKK